MEARGFSETLSQWLASSLVPVAGSSALDGLTWTFDIKGVKRHEQGSQMDRPSVRFPTVAYMQHALHGRACASGPSTIFAGLTGHMC